MNESHPNFDVAITPFVSDIHTDVLGNIIAHKPGKGKRIMLIAHHDVVRLMITHIDSNGFLYIKPAGNIDLSILPARKIVIKHEDQSITGIIGKKPFHLMREEPSPKVSYDNLWIDIGAKDVEDAKRMVSIGDYAYFCSEWEELSNNLVTGSYFDDQIGLKVLEILAERLNDVVMQWDVYFVASNHEEIGMRGASVVAYSIHPDICICIDVTHATDYPSINIINDGDIKLGSGCVLANGPNIHSEIFNKLQDIANKNNINYQIEANPYPTGTDANIIQLNCGGVKTAVISIPCRYMHTPYEVCSKRDMESTVELISKFLA